MLRSVTVPLVLLLGASAGAQDNSLHDLMGDAMKMTAPTSEHDLLRRLAGDWTYVVEMTMPGMPTMHGSGTTSIREILGGRFIEFRSTSDLMNPPVESVGILGYDSRKGREQYFALWVDTLGHYYIDPRGTWNRETASLVLHGEEFDPSTGLASPYRQVFRFPGEDTMTCEVFISMPGARGDVRMVGIVYRRHQGRNVVDPPLNPLNARRPAHRTNASEVPEYSAEDIETMDSTQLQRAIISIMRARTMPGIEQASRSRLDDQYTWVLSRMRSMPTIDRHALGTAPGDDVEPHSIPSFADDVIAGMTAAEARAALVEIASMRRNPSITDEEREELKELFDKVYVHMKKLREAPVPKSNDG